MKYIKSWIPIIATHLNKKPIEKLLENIAVDKLVTRSIENNLGKEAFEVLQIANRYNNYRDIRMEIPFTLKVSRKRLYSSQARRIYSR